MPNRRGSTVRFTDLLSPDVRFNVNYHEGATVGYKWFDAKGLKPLFPFGHGLSYTTFTYSGLNSKIVNGNLQVSFTVTNTGKIKGKDVPQVYVSPSLNNWEAPKRLGGFDKVELLPGESKSVNLMVDPRLLGMFDSATKTWRVSAAAYKVSVAHSAADTEPSSVTITLAARTLNVLGKDIKQEMK